jgi:hypothetical protein
LHFFPLFPCSLCNKWILFSFVHWLSMGDPLSRMGPVTQHLSCEVMHGMMKLWASHVRCIWRMMGNLRSGMDPVDGQDAHLGSQLGCSKFSCCYVRSRALIPWLHLCLWCLYIWWAVWIYNCWMY